MKITAALDGPKQRDLLFYADDEQTITVEVYARDGDTDAIDPGLVTNRKILVGWGPTIPVDVEFTVPHICCGRRRYRLVADVSGVTTTLAYGVMTTAGASGCWPYDYGFLSWS